jgi:hypothetical protein
MQIEARWKQEVALTPVKVGTELFNVNIDLIPETSGIYVFMRRYEKKSYPIYIGQALNIRKRIVQQKNNLKLMLGISRHDKGAKSVLCCVIRFKPGQNKAKTLSILERAIIDHCLTQGYELLNKQGVRVKYETIKFKGNRTSEDLFGRIMLIKART